MTMSNSQVFGSPMILTDRKAVSPFGTADYAQCSETAAAERARGLGASVRRLLAPTGRDRRLRRTMAALSTLDDRMLRDLGLDRPTIVSAAQAAEPGQRSEERRVGNRRVSP